MIVDTFTTTLVSDRWNETVAAPTYDKWRNLAQLAAQIADAVEENDPNSIMVVSLKAVYQEAYKRMLAMVPAREAA